MRARLILIIAVSFFAVAAMPALAVDTVATCELDGSRTLHLNWSVDYANYHLYDIDQDGVVRLDMTSAWPGVERVNNGQQSVDYVFRSGSDQMFIFSSAGTLRSSKGEYVDSMTWTCKPGTLVISEAVAGAPPVISPEEFASQFGFAPDVNAAVSWPTASDE